MTSEEDSARSAEPYDVRVRVTARTASALDAHRVASEVEALYTNGPAGGAGATKQVREVLAVGTTFIPRERVTSRVRFEEA